MKRAWCLVWLAAAGCSLDDVSGVLLGAAKGSSQPAPRAHSEEAAAPLAESVYLDAWLPVGEGRCRVEDVARALTETREPPPGQRLRPDVDVVMLHLRCEDARGRPLEPAQALGADLAPRLRLDAGPALTPSERTILSERQPKPLVFELPPGAEPLPNARSFDARTGAPLAPPRYGTARLSLESARERREIVLRERDLTPELDAWLARAATSLAGHEDAPPAEATSRTQVPKKAGPAVKGAAPGAKENAEGVAEAALGAARTLYRDTLEKLAPERLSVTELARDAQGRPLVTLSLDRARNGPGPGPVLSLRFTLEATSGGALQATHVETLKDARNSLACAEDAAALRARARKQAPKQTSSSAHCNVLGLPLPGACEQLPADLRDAALRHQLRCVPGLSAWLRDGGRPLPDDFLLTLRRGRARSALDPTPRYVLSLYANGSVVFHGRSFVHSTERSDGRTSPKLLRGLFARLEELAWFDRRGGSWNAKTCSAKDAGRDVFTVHAGGRERMVIDREGCRGPFSSQELSQLREWIELIAGVSGWTAPYPMDDDARVAEWVVTAD